MQISYSYGLKSPTVSEFRTALLTRPLNELVDEYVFSDRPFAFRELPEAMPKLRSHLSTRLKLNEKNVVIVGSAQVGFSLSPDSFFRPFSKESDIDVLVVDEKLFDTIWTTILQWHYPRRSWLDASDWGWAKQRQKELYWGWFTPSRIRFDGLTLPEMLRPVRDLSASWFNAFRSLALYREFSRRDVSGRLYRTWDHARMYHMNGLAQIREMILRGQQET
jgi:hypothetical protein